LNKEIFWSRKEIFLSYMPIYTRYMDCVKNRTAFSTQDVGFFGR
jgi:hypothetical protein